MWFDFNRILSWKFVATEIFNAVNDGVAKNSSWMEDSSWSQDIRNWKKRYHSFKTIYISTIDRVVMSGNQFLWIYRRVDSRLQIKDRRRRLIETRIPPERVHNGQYEDSCLIIHLCMYTVCSSTVPLFEATINILMIE